MNKIGAVCQTSNPMGLHKYTAVISMISEIRYSAGFRAETVLATSPNQYMMQEWTVSHGTRNFVASTVYRGRCGTGFVLCATAVLEIRVLHFPRTVQYWEIDVHTTPVYSTCGDFSR